MKGQAKLRRFGLSAFRHVLRVAALALAALSLTSAVAAVTGVTAAVVGTVFGAVLGELLGRSRLKTSVLIVGHVCVLFLVWIASCVATHWGWLPGLVGPGVALTIDVVLRFLGFGVGIVSGLRCFAVRRPAAMALELVLLAGALSVLFAAHRDAVIERPLWLSDWAWRQGWNPAHVLLGIGGAAVVVLAILLLAESRRRVSLASILLLPLLALITVSVLGISNLRQPEVDRDLGLTEEVEGEEPPPQNTDSQPGGGDTGERVDAGSSEGEEECDAGSSEGEEERDAGPPEGEGEQDAGQPQPSGHEGGGQPRQPEEGESNRPSPSESLDQQDNSAPSTSPAPVAVVLLDDDYSPESQAYYFRQSAWSEYNGTRLVATRRDDADQDLLRLFPTLRTRVRRPPAIAGRTLVHGRVAILTNHAAPFALESPVTFAPLHNPNPARFQRAWRFESRAQTLSFGRLQRRSVGDPRWSDDVRRHYTTGPDDPRYADLAREIISRLPATVREDPFTQALAIKLYLDRELIYSTRERHAGHSDPAAHMLFGNRTGYCVHFAHAAVYLWRSLGIPSRVGTGYQVPEDHRRGSTIMIRANDGHAWPELYVEGVGWVILDIAAQRNLDPPAQPLDEDLQEMLGEMARETPLDPFEPDDSEPLWPTMWRDLGGAMIMVLFALLVSLYILKVWRRLIPRVEEPRYVPRVGYRYALDLLAEAGWVREHGETREQFALRLREVVPALTQLTAWHVAARFGDPAGAIEQRVEYRPDLWLEGLQSFRKQLRGQTHWARRLFGMLNPISFFFAR